MTFIGDREKGAVAGPLRWIGSGLMALLVTACGASTPPATTLDSTPPDFYEGARILLDVHLVDLIAGNPLFDVTDKRGIHYGTLALTAGEQALEGLPTCQTAIPGPMAPCTPCGARNINGRLSMGVVEFGGQTGLYYIDAQAICFNSMTTIEGCHQLAIRYDGTIDVKTSGGDQNLWILR